MTWRALSKEELSARVFVALGDNRSYREEPILGLPGSFLDRKVFPRYPGLASSPLLSTLVENPNHIGCHTLGHSEPFFSGTHELERQVVEACAVGLLRAKPGCVDGYIASGGTESNLQALWTFRNHLQRAHGAKPGEIAVLCSEDTHYSMPKAADILGLSLYRVPVSGPGRRVTAGAVRAVVREAKGAGIRRVLVVLNMGTTMFGTVDDPDEVLPVIQAEGLDYLAHVDAAFGGFIYPLTHPNCPLDFRDSRLTSFTLDAHKMLQAPYGTGIHLIRKGWIDSVTSADASYVPGLDCTVVGSRSGANAVAVWMILFAHGPEGGRRFCGEILARTDRFCQGLDGLGVRYVREPYMNVVAMRASDLPDDVSARFSLVPDTHEGVAAWRKLVVMDHVDQPRLDALLTALRSAR